MFCLMLHPTLQPGGIQGKEGIKLLSPGNTGAWCWNTGTKHTRGQNQPSVQSRACSGENFCGYVSRLYLLKVVGIANCISAAAAAAVAEDETVIAQLLAVWNGVSTIWKNSHVHIYLREVLLMPADRGNRDSRNLFELNEVINTLLSSCILDGKQIKLSHYGSNFSCGYQEMG